MQVNMKREALTAQLPMPSGNMELVKLDERRSQVEAVKAKSRQDASGTKGNGKKWRVPRIHSRPSVGVQAHTPRTTIRKKSTGTGTLPKISSFGQSNFISQRATFARGHRKTTQNPPQRRQPPAIFTLATCPGLS
jgi:hypothetical protein